MHQEDQQSAPFPAHLRRRPSPAAWCGIGLLALLGLSLWIPIGSARRTARAESRGEAIAGLLLREAVACDLHELGAPRVAGLLRARLLAAAAAAGVFVEDLELLEDAPPESVAFVNKHYVIQLRWSPSPGAEPAASTGGLRPALEVLAWPLEPTGPAHAAFFFPEDAEPAYTRNLAAGYVGLDPEHMPRAGDSHRRPDGNAQRWHYRGYDDERWILLDRPHQRAES